MSADTVTTSARSAWGADIEPLLERLDGEGESLVARAENWSTINSGSFELPGLAAMRVTLLDTPETRGMIHKVRHLVTVAE